MSEANETGKASIPVERIVICRVDSEGRDVTDMPGLHSEDDLVVTCPLRNPFLMCRKCDVGEYHSKPTASWMNRWKCDKCGHCCSK